MKKLKPVTPGEILIYEFMLPTLADELGVEREKFEQIIRGEEPITIDVAHRLSRKFGNTHQFWLTLQEGYEERRG